MDITIFGTGYVGLVTGTGFAEMGNHVTCVDVDAAKVRMLQAGEIPIYEVGLQELVEENVHAGRLTFTTDAAAAVQTACACFICVGTPMAENGEADLRYVEAVARAIGQHLRAYTVVVTKSTVPVGTAEKVRGWIQESLDQRGLDIPFAVGSNPEFLKEGSALEDFMKPDRVVIGTDDPRAEGILRDIYSPFIRNGLRFYSMDIRSAEMTKYAANCMLATKISFINEIASICEEVGADVRQVRQGVGADSRIGLQFLHPGLGYGGSCFPKDVRALIHVAEAHGCNPAILKAVDKVNRVQKTLLMRKLQQWCELKELPLAGLIVAMWGIAFKPNTDDVREAPSLELIQALLAAGARVQAHDPKAMVAGRQALNDPAGVSWHEDQYDACAGADILFLVTEWRPFRRPDFKRLAENLRHRCIFDGRNQYDDQRAAEYGLQVFPIGVSRSPTAPTAPTTEVGA
ncbi:MAG: UDP-glucose/GDP-mannose dehydrogenase family protein [Planctomycetota bacterium]|nr:MAG: UDP-glucose/GDP-mannose dehydrogenase family protein [Planctomycetota bacterium]